VKTSVHCDYVSVLLGMRNVADGSFRENQNTIYVKLLFFPFKNCNGRAEQATDDNMAHVQCFLDN
jgi:hypothetical protein